MEPPWVWRHRMPEAVLTFKKDVIKGTKKDNNLGKKG